MACCKTSASLSSALVVGLILASCFFNGGESAQCMPDSVNPCRATCNGTSFDLSKAFDFPLNITEPGPRSDGRTDPDRKNISEPNSHSDGLARWWYMWNPCESYHCPGYLEKSDCAVCQYADGYWCCGQTLRPIFNLKMPISISSSTTFPNYTIEYTFGSAWRIAFFHFAINNTVEEPVVKFISEHPFLQYNFLVTGKCIGQESSECIEYYEKRKLKSSRDKQLRRAEVSKLE